MQSKNITELTAQPNDERAKKNSGKLFLAYINNHRKNIYSLHSRMIGALLNMGIGA